MKLQVVIQNVNYDSTVTLVTGTDYSIIVVRSTDNTLTISVNGVVSTFSNVTASTLKNGTGYWTIGADQGADEAKFNGTVKNLTITKGA
jgi:hypothetical protein